MNFWKVYLRSYNTDSTAPTVSECEALSPEQEAALEKEGLYGAALSHLFWAIWSFLQSFKSDIQFGYTVSGLARNCPAGVDVPKLSPPNSQMRCSHTSHVV